MNEDGLSQNHGMGQKPLDQLVYENFYFSHQVPANNILHTKAILQGMAYS